MMAVITFWNRRSSSGVQLRCWGETMKLRTFVVYWKHSGKQIADVQAMTAERAIAYAAEAFDLYETDLAVW